MKRLFVLCLVLAAAWPLAAQKEPGGPEATALKNLAWRPIGPANPGGRVSVIVGVPGDPATFYVAGGNGGIFRTRNGGTSYTAIFDKQPVTSIGAIAIAPSNPKILYVGTGEGNPRNDASIGNGVYRSNDGGDTWAYLGLDDTDQIARIVIDPRNPNVAYVAALGHEWGPTENRGLFRTTDGGRTWQKILYKGPQTGCSDVDIDPTNANVVYAGMWTYLRRPWHFDSGGGETAVYKSVDGGETWKKLTNGLPKGPMDRIGISVAPSNPGVVYVVSETKDEGELWRSDDAGETWRVVNRDPNINFRPFYYSDIHVDPHNPNRIFSLAGGFYLSDDGGRTFDRIGGDIHSDHQAIWIDPTDPNHILEGCDGGWQVSWDGAKTWEMLNTLSFAQFYHIAYDMQRPYTVCGGLQDNGTWCGPSRTTSNQGIRKADWVTVGGGDGFFAVPDLKDPHLVYVDSQGGGIELMDIKSGTSRTIHPYPNRVGSAGDAISEHKYRFNWNSPIVLAPGDPKTVYFGGNVVFKTTNAGQSWTIISPDLTTNDKSKQQSSGGPVVVDNTAAEFHCTILTIAPSPLNANVIWAGTDDGNVQVTKDGGKTWTNTTKNITGLAPFAWVSAIDASHFDAGTAYVAADHHQDNDYAPYAFKTTDYGQTWKPITGNLPAKGWVHIVREDPKNRNLLYAGTEFGLFATWDGGARWVSIRNNIPVNPVRDILVHPRDNDVIVATHGRGAYILDDATALQQIGEAMKADAHLFDPQAAVRYSLWNREENLGGKEYSAPNPPFGALITYYLKAEPKEDVSIAITDKTGKEIRRIPRAPKLEGVNRAVWDLRYEAARAAATEGPTIGGGRGGGSGAAAGMGGGRFGGGAPLAVPGEYVVHLRVGGKDLTKPLRVDMDPRVQVSAADLQAQMDAGLALRDLTARVNGLVERTDDLIRQLTALADQLRRAPRTAPSVAAEAGDGRGGDIQAPPVAAGPAQLASAALKDLRTLRDTDLARPLQGLNYRQYPRLREEVQSLSGAVTRTAAGPTDAQRLRMQELITDTDRLAAALNKIISGPVAEVNKALSGTPHVR